MSGWNLVFFIAAVPFALVVALLGLVHFCLAAMWLSRGEDSPSAIPLFGLLFSAVLLALAFAQGPKWASIGAASIASFGALSELALAGARAITVRRRRLNAGDPGAK